MAGEQIINEVVTRAKMEGVSQAAQEAKTLDAALDGVAVASDKVEKATVSNARALQSLLRQIDPTYAATQRLENGQKLLEKAFASGEIQADEMARRMEQLQAKYGEVAGAATTATAKIAQGAEEQGRLVDELNQKLNVKSDFGGAERASDIAAYGQELDRLRAKYDPLFAAGQKYKATLTEIREAHSAGALSETAYAAAIQKTKDAFASQVTALKGAADAVSGGSSATAKGAKEIETTFGLAVYQARNLINQFADLGVQIGSGQGLFRPILQQGPQIVDALSMSPGGVGGAIAAIRASLTGLGPIATAAFAAVGTAAVVASGVLASSASRALEHYQDQFRILTKSAADAKAQFESAANVSAGTGVSLSGAASAQQNIVAASLPKGPLNTTSMTKIPDTSVVEGIIRGATVSGGDATSLLGSLTNDIRNGSLEMKTLNQIMEDSPKFAKAFLDALGGAPKVFHDMGEGAKISSQQIVTAIQAAQRPMRELEKTYIPSIGQAFSELSNKASTAGLRIASSFAAGSKQDTSALTTLITKLGDGFTYLGQHADGTATTLKALGVGLTALAGGPITAAIAGFILFGDQIKLTADGSVTLKSALFALPGALDKAAAAAEQAASRANKGASEWNVFAQAVGRAGDTLQTLGSPDKFFESTSREIQGLVGLWDALIAKIDAYITKSTFASRLSPDAQAARGAAAQAALPPMDVGLGAVAGNNTPGAVGYRTTGEMFGPPMPSSMVPPVDPDRFVRPITDSLKATTSATTTGASTVSDSVDKMGGLVATKYGDGITVWSSKISETTGAAKDGATATKSADTANQRGLSGVEQAVRAIRIPAGGGGNPLATVSRTDGGGTPINVDGSDRAAIDMARFLLSGPSWMYAGAQGSYVANNTISAMSGSQSSAGSISAALPEGTHLAGNVMSGYAPAPDKIVTGERMSDADLQRFGLGKYSPAAKAANENTATAAIGNQVSDAIQRLQGQQDAVMGRQYTPDAYTDKNPDMFYSGGKIFREQQDKQWTELQKSVNHLASLKAQGDALLKQGATLPAAFAAALAAELVKAGVTGDQIAAAMNGLKPSTSGTSQPGYLANSNGATRTRMTIGA